MHLLKRTVERSTTCCIYENQKKKAHHANWVGLKARKLPYYGTVGTILTWVLLSSSPGPGFPRASKPSSINTAITLLHVSRPSAKDVSPAPPGKGVVLVTLVDVKEDEPEEYEKELFEMTPEGCSDSFPTWCSPTKSITFWNEGLSSNMERSASKPAPSTASSRLKSAQTKIFWGQFDVICCFLL